MILADVPIFRDLARDEQARVRALAHEQRIAAGEVLFYEGDPVLQLFLIVAGRCAISREGQPSGEGHPGVLLDLDATLGGLPHAVKVTVADDAVLLAWEVAELWAVEPFAAAARRHLALALQTAQARVDALEAPLHYQNAGATLVPGPFIFEDVTLFFAFCEADLDFVRPTLPEGLRLVRRPGRRRDSLLLALADFPQAYPEHDPAARFAYTETTCFVPVRYGRQVGLYAPYIYPSTWEPILLGREIYGFPKRLGRTVFAPRAVSLSVDGDAHLSLHWEALEAADEPRLVRALMDWLGFDGRSATLVFQAGDTLRRAMRLPRYRRVEVFNHKCILAADATIDSPTYAVNCLTQAIFGVLGWVQIARMGMPDLVVSGGPLAGADLALREAFRTRLDMRLSTGRVLRDYNRPGETGPASV